MLWIQEDFQVIEYPLSTVKSIVKEWNGNKAVNQSRAAVFRNRLTVLEGLTSVKAL